MTRTLAFAAALVVTGALFLAAAVDAGQRAGVPAPRAVQPMKAAPAGPLPPMPLNGPLARPREVVAAVYEFAARHPEVLQYIPCYCGCEQVGHSGNHDCFIQSRDAAGRVQWDPHGTHCAVCIDVARDSMLMFNSGASVVQIRAAIDQKWGTRAATQTPTPRPQARPRS
jgi:hypothetical protein